MAQEQGNEQGVVVPARVGTSTGPWPKGLVAGRAVQPMGYLDSSNARVPGFEDITEQPDWGGYGFAGRKSDVRVVRFDRLPHAPAADDSQSGASQ